MRPGQLAYSCTREAWREKKRATSKTGDRHHPTRGAGEVTGGGEGESGEALREC
jgi:hypothetical protein